jgi:arylsulfatase A-like enzyme
MSTRSRALGVALVLAGGCSPKPLPPPAHVLLIVVDTQRADHLSCYGYPRPTSPTIDALAKEGVLFEHAVSQASWTLPSMVSMMTSSYLAEEVISIPEGKPTLAEEFRRGGFATGAFICNNLLSPENHFDRGFDVDEWELVPYGSNEKILEWIRGHANERTFTFVHLNEVHDDVAWDEAAKHACPRPDGSNYGPEPLAEKARFRGEKGAISKERREYYDGVAVKLHLEKKDESLAKIGAEIGGYDDDVLYSDGRIREILDEYRKLGLWDSTAVVIAADHGEGLWTREQFYEGTRKTAIERGEAPTLLNVLQMTHGSQAAIELVHVPLVLKAPGLAPARVRDAWVENVDIAPTLLALCRIDRPASMQGRSLVDLARDPSRKDGLVEGAFTFSRYHTSTISQEGMQLLHAMPQGECEFALGDELHDLPRDPEARKNLLAERADVARSLAKVGQDRMHRALRGGSNVIGPETMKTLGGLGYIDSGVVDAIREELAETKTEGIVRQLAESHNCLLKLQMIRALKGRELLPEQIETLHAMLAKESSAAVQGELRTLLPR